MRLNCLQVARAKAAPYATADQERDWLAFAVAAYGAVVATALAASQLVRDRPGAVASTPGADCSARRDENGRGTRDGAR